MRLMRPHVPAAGMLVLLLLSLSSAARDRMIDLPRSVALSTIDQTQVELTQDMIDRYIAVDHEVFRTPGLLFSQASDPARRPLFDAIATRHGFPDYKACETVETNIGFVMAGTDPDTRAYIGRDAVIASLVADVEKDKSVPASLKVTRISIIKSLKDDTPDQLIPGNIPVVIKNYDRILRSMKGED